MYKNRMHNLSKRQIFFWSVCICITKRIRFVRRFISINLIDRNHYKVCSFTELSLGVQEKRKGKEKPSIHFVNVFSSCPSFQKRRRSFVWLLRRFSRTLCRVYLYICIQKCSLCTKKSLAGVKSFFPCACLLDLVW